MTEKKSNKPQVNRGPLRLQHWNIVAVLLAIYDMFAVSLSYFAALMLRFDLRYSMIPDMYLGPWMKFAPFYAVYCVIIF